LKYLFLSLILLLTSCSLSKDSAYWNEDLIKKSSEDKKLSKILKKTGDYKSMTFDEFNLFLKDYSNNAEYPDINQ
jgi:capsule polysaccharide export protein KpsE/RkpR